MRFSYADTFGGPEQALDAYERLIHDVMVGDRTLFTTSEAIERLWEISEPVLEDPPPVDALRARLLGAAGGRRADRAAPLAPAERPRLSAARERKRAPDGALCFRRTYHQRVLSRWLVGPQAFEVIAPT